MIRPCAEKALCPDNIFYNLSSELPDNLDFPGIHVNPDIPCLICEWTKDYCEGICHSTISQEDADLCAELNAQLCTNLPPDELFYSAAAFCPYQCGDGTLFYYVLQEATFTGRSQEEADAKAASYACERAQKDHVCMGPIDRCTCANEEYSTVMSVSPLRPVIFDIVSGDFPPGISFPTGLTVGQATLSGTPTVAGLYSFTVRATDVAGNYMLKTYVISVLEIDDTPLPEYTIGEPYSHQMTATGGLGTLAWRVVEGVLPTGITISSDGLLSGTPTAAGSANLRFEVRDLSCEVQEEQQYPPAVEMVTRATTTIKTYRGYPEYTPFDGTLYKRLSVSGSITQTGLTRFNSGAGGGEPEPGNRPCGKAKYTYSGISEIDANGTFISRHSKILTVQCNAKVPPPTLLAYVNIPGEGTVPGTIPNMISLFGYCWPDDPGSCDTCEEDPELWIPIGDYSTTSSRDFPYNMLTSGTRYSIPSPTVLTYIGEAAFLGASFDPQEVTNFPLTIIPQYAIDVGYGNGIAPWLNIGSDGDFEFVLSVPYTDADAESTKVVFTGGGKTADNTPNFLNYVNNNIQNNSSRIVAVEYDLNFTNLVIGREYFAVVDYFYSTGQRQSQQYTFTAEETTHKITDNIPTPSAGVNITVRNPRVRFN